jgi:hypothetical protein
MNLFTPSTHAARVRFLSPHSNWLAETTLLTLRYFGMQKIPTRWPHRALLDYDFVDFVDFF